MTATSTAKAMKNNKSADVQAAVKNGDYTPPFEQSMPYRTAHFLDWAATHFQQEYVPYNFILRAIQGYKKTPRLDSEEVENLRRKMSRVRQMLQTQYKRELTTSPGNGARATASDIDAVKTEIRRKVVRLNSAKLALEQSASIVDPARMPSCPEKKWFVEDVASIIKTLKSPSFEARLALPAGYEKDNNED